MMDSARLVEVSTRLLDSLGDRIADRQETFRSLFWAGEEDVGVDMLVGELVARNIVVTPQERDMVRELLYHFDIEQLDEQYYPDLVRRDEMLSRLKVVEP